MKISRRSFLALGAAAASGCASTRFWPDDGLFNPCLPAALPESLRDDAIVLGAWDGIDPTQVWDCHAHLAGVGDSSDAWFNPRLRSWLQPVQRAQFAFYLNAACADGDSAIDTQFVTRLRQLIAGFPAGARAMLLAFDYFHSEQGVAEPARSTFHTPNHYAAAVAKLDPDRFEWIASIHPYRADAVDALKACIAQGARAVKWLPPAMNIDPSSPRCDAFYAALARHNLPLLTHAGQEQAVDAGELQRMGNPLLLRRALDHGVRVIATHCASLGVSPDLDRGPNGAETPNIDLFARLMREPRYEHRLYGDISAVVQVNRDESILRRIFTERDWHPRLLNGSDYPLPAIPPLVSVNHFVRNGYLTRAQADVLLQLRRHNALLFDFVLKRLLRIDGIALPSSVFRTRDFFVRSN